MATETTKIPYVEGSAPATPAANRVVTYAKADGLMYSKDDAGVETLMSGGAGGGVTVQDEGTPLATLGTTLNFVGSAVTATGTGATKTITVTGGSSTFVGCRAYSSATQNISTATITAVTFDTEEYDTDTIHSTSSNTSRFTVPTGKDGKWRFTGGSSYAFNATGDRYFWWRVNGATEVHGGVTREVPPATSQASAFGPVPVTLNLVATDYVEMISYQTSGSTLAIGNAGGDIKFQSFCEAVFLGA